LIWCGLSCREAGFSLAGNVGSGSPFVVYSQRLAGLVFVVLAIVFVGAGELFEEVRVLDGGGDLVVSAGPFAEVNAAAAVGAEGEVFAAREDDGAAGGAAQRFGFRGGRLRHSLSLILFRCATK
jgi:hypothetical protein